MTTTAKLKGRVLFVTGASRGIGRAIALRAARDGARIAVLGKTAEPHPNLPGTVAETCEAIRDAGGEALECVCDVRSEEQVREAVRRTLERFGGIDMLVNNASAISLTRTLDTPMKRFDLMQAVNVRATYLCAQACLPALERSPEAHILTLSPPLQLRPEWFGPHLAYSLSKYGMSLCTLGLAEELRGSSVRVNSLWPRTLIATAALRLVPGADEAFRSARKPEIVADAAYAIFSGAYGNATGQFFIDEDVLRATGISDFAHYSVDPNREPAVDLFV